MSSTTRDWPIDIDRQGQHSTDVDLKGIRRFLNQFALPIILNGMMDEDLLRMIKEEAGISAERLWTAFFDSGNWKLNMERKGLKSSAHYRSNTMRIYDEDFAIRSLRPVIQLDGNERRYGHLHMPPKLSQRETVALSLLLLSSFRATHATEHIGAAQLLCTMDAADALERPSIRTKKQHDPNERMIKHCRTVFRSKERRLDFLRHYRSQSGDDFGPIPYDKFDLVLKQFWDKSRRASDLRYNSVIRSILVANASNLSGMVTELIPGHFSLGEYGETLIDEYWDLQKRVEAEERLAAQEACDKRIRNLTQQRQKHWDSLKKTCNELREEKEKRKLLG